MQQRARLSFLCLTMAGAVSATQLGCDNGADGTGGGSGTSSSNGSPASTTGSPTAGSSTSGSPAGSTSGSAGTSSGGTFVDNGYVSVGPWMGYGFTVADTLGEGTTVTPTCGGSTCTPAFTGNQFCFSGSVAPDAAYGGFALLGWNLNQASAASSPIDPWTVPTSGGVTITLDNMDSNTDLRLQVQEPNATSNTQRYCATLQSGVEIPWSTLESECYNSTPGPAVQGGVTQLVNAAVQVYGNNMTAVPFNICITGMSVQ
jgi:hypothetical protein